MALPLLALPTTSVGANNEGLTPGELSMLRRSVLLGELQRLQSDNEAPPGAPEGGKWRLIKVVIGWNNITEKAVWYVRNRDGSEEGYEESGAVVKIATKEDIAEAARRANIACKAFCFCFIALTIGAVIAVVVITTSQSARHEERVSQQA